MNVAIDSVIKIVGRINRLILKVEKSILIVLMVGMLIFGFLQVFARFILKTPIGWSEELLTYSFTWCSFMGASMAIYSKSHFSVDLLMKKLPPALTRPITIFTWTLICLFSLFLLVMGYKLTAANSIQRMNILPISMLWAYLAVPVCGAFIFLHALEKTMEIVFRIEGAAR